MRVFVVLAMVALSARAATLDDLLKAAEKLRDSGRGAEIDAPQMEFKHALRDWIESRIPLGLLGEQLMAELKEAGLTTGWSFGSVSKIEITRPANYFTALVVKTGVGAGCGSDDSWYIYELTAGGWKRVLNYERSEPITYSSIEISPADREGSRVVLISGMYPSCASVHNANYYRVFRVGPWFDSAITLLDGSRPMYIDSSVPHGAEASRAGFTLEFEACCLTQGLERRTIILKYRVEGDHATRVDPVALNPQDFVDEWVRQPWSEMQNWTAKNSRARLEKWHKRFEGDKWKLPEFEFVQRCSRPGQWQIAAAELEGERTYYFLVSEGTGGRYEMVDISTKRQPGCPGETPPDFTIRSVFPKTPER